MRPSYDQKLFRRFDLSFDAKIRGVVDHLPESLQHQELAYARAIVNHKEYKTTNFLKTDWKISTGILVRDKFVGLVEVGYLKEWTTHGQEMFIREERSLLEVVAEFLGMAIENESLKKST